MSTDNKRFNFIDELEKISNKKDLADYERYREMGEKCILADFFNGQDKYLTYVKDKESGKVEKVFKKKPRFQDKRNGFIAVNVEVPTIGLKKAPIIPFFSIAKNGICDESSLRGTVLDISKKSINDKFLTCPDFVNRYNIEKILFKIEINNGAIVSIEIPPILSAFDGNNDELRRQETIDEMVGLLSVNKENSFLQSWCEPSFMETNQTLFCNVRAVDWDSKKKKSHSIFVCIFNTEEEIIEWVSAYGDDVMNIIAMVKSVFISDVQQAQRKEAIKSAKAAIMSRNMSHNLGSHVMAYLKHHLSSVRDMLNDKILSLLFENEDDLKKLIQSPSEYSPKLLAKINPSTRTNPDKNITQEKNVIPEAKTKTSDEDVINNVALPFLVGLGQFISYLQERQDFIATIATDYIPYYSSVNFKDFIYDELNNDKRYERHPDRQNLKPDNILLGNIARSEGLGRVTCPTNSLDDKTSLHDIVLKFRTTFNGDPVEKIEMPKVNPLDYYDESVLSRAKEELDEMRNYDVSLPGGIVGRQAIFSIIENIIRNAAKHGNWRDKGKLEISIDIFSKEDVLNPTPSDILKERLCDNDNSSKYALSLKQVLFKYYCGKGDKGNDLYFITITDNLSMSTVGSDVEQGIAPTSITSLRKALIEDYIDDTNSQMKNSNKGMKEMRISSAWLRSMEDDKRYFLYNEDNYNLEDGKWGESTTEVPPVLYARMSKDQLGECHLQYIFCLVRPQKIAFVSTAFQSVPEDTEQELRKHFWKTFTPESFIQHNNKSFDMIVYDGSDDKADPFYSLIRRKSSSRFISLLSNEATGLNAINSIKSAIINGENLTKKMLDEAELLLYRFLSGWDGTERILLSDTKAQNHFEQDAQKDTGVLNKITFKPNDEAAKYRYITHLEDRIKFREHVINDYDYAKRFEFSEGITGNNSTDRLIRNERITELWFYKHLHSMKQKVAIFDERIFSKSFGIEESDLSMSVFDDPKYASFKNASEEVRQKLLQSRNLSSRIDLNVTDTKNYIGATYIYKGVFVFTIIRSNEREDTFNLYGCSIERGNGPTFSKCVKYASFLWDAEAKKLSITPYEGVDKKVLSGYNAISIHQGLLDKLYGLFGIKSDSQARENLTRDFYTQFVGESKIVEFPDEHGEDYIHYFLPGMTIHSGRSKPSENDMPQRLPFIPFSAIEHAVIDCKYSLIELLDSARYE